ncbi:MAG: hemin uptake protein HemP [Myxococcota bacterium]
MPADSPTRGDERSGGAVRTLAAREILGAGGVVRIDLDGEIYTLRLTRNHRLILTK